MRRSEDRGDVGPAGAGIHLDDVPLKICGDVSLRLLALELGANGEETYVVSFRTTPAGPFRRGRMTHAGGASWTLVEGLSLRRVRVTLGSPDDVFRFALGAGPDAQRAVADDVTRAAPHWPTFRTERLARRRLAGEGTVAFDARWFLSELATSAFDRPLLFPDATSKLGLAGLEEASEILSAIAFEDDALAEVLARASRNGALHWEGEGRLIAELVSGELAQLGTDVRDGCRAAIGTGPLVVVFDAGEPLGLGLGPAIRAPDDDDSCGMGVVVGEVDEGGAAERAGVTAWMALQSWGDPDGVLPSDGRRRLPFEDALRDIDERRAAGGDLTITFDTAAAATHLYAVEMPAGATLAALAVANGMPVSVDIDDVGAALDAMCDGALLWREAIPRLFIGEPGSLTCAHTDICPQLEIAHGLSGTKLLGVASHRATPRLVAEHAGDDDSDEEAIDVDATLLPTDRPLTPRQSRLLGEPDLTVALLRKGDLAIFDSGALHLASNGAEGMSAAVYHGAITPAAVPRLRLAAEATGSRAVGGAYRDHLFAADLLHEVEKAALERA